MTPVIFAPDARAEFLTCVRYYEDCQSNLGRRLRSAVEAAVQQIAEVPLRYRVLHAPFRCYLLPNSPLLLST
jgi:plasmid stabilization system protein ParE